LAPGLHHRVRGDKTALAPPWDAMLVDPTRQRVRRCESLGNSMPHQDQIKVTRADTRAGWSQVESGILTIPPVERASHSCREGKAN